MNRLCHAALDSLHNLHNQAYIASIAVEDLQSMFLMLNLILSPEAQVVAGEVLGVCRQKACRLCQHA